MNLDFVFLKNSSLLQEIRKHKWIESEKAGHDIGFATAAFDWMTKYYAVWTQEQKIQPRPAISRQRELAMNR